MDNTKHVPYGHSIETRIKLQQRRRKNLKVSITNRFWVCILWSIPWLLTINGPRKIKGFSVRVRGYEMRFNTPDHLDRVLWRWMLLKKVRSSFRQRDHTTPDSNTLMVFFGFFICYCMSFIFITNSTDTDHISMIDQLHW